MNENGASLAGNGASAAPEPSKPISLEEMRRILEQEHGVVFEPKEVPEIPEINQERVTALIPEEYHELAEEYIGKLRVFVREGRVITTPQFSDDLVGDDARRNWVVGMKEKYGDAFEEAYSRRNQLRKTNLSRAAEALVLLAGWVEELDNQEEAQRLKELVKPLWYRLNGEDLDNPGEKIDRDYNELSLAGKKQVVSDFEKGALAVLHTFS